MLCFLNFSTWSHIFKSLNMRHLPLFLIIWNTPLEFIGVLKSQIWKLWCKKSVFWWSVSFISSLFTVWSISSPLLLLFETLITHRTEKHFTTLNFKRPHFSHRNQLSQDYFRDLDVWIPGGKTNKYYVKGIHWHFINGFFVISKLDEKSCISFYFGPGCMVSNVSQ